MVKKYYEFSCDDCKKVVVKYPSRQKGQNMGWAIARDGNTCYCPACAPFHRSVGKKAKSGQQLKIG